MPKRRPTLTAISVVVASSCATHWPRTFVWLMYGVNNISPSYTDVIT